MIRRLVRWSALGVFLLVLFGVAVSDAFAVPFPNMERGANYDREYLGLNEDGLPLYRWNSAPERILDGNQYVPYVHTEQNGDHIIRTAQNTITFNSDTCRASMQEGDSGDTGIFSDYYQPFRMANGTGSWIHVSQVTNADCNVSVVTDGDDIEIHATREVENVGRFVVKYIKEYGKPWKSQLEPTNLSALTNQHFGVRQFIEVPRIIYFAGQDRDLANHNGTTFNRTWLENNKANLIDFKNGISFDFDLGWQHLQSVTIHYYGGDTAILQFDYFRNTQIILPGQTFVIDPTYSQVYDTKGRVYYSGATADCSSVTGDVADTGVTVAKINAATGCQMQWFEWTDLATIPTYALVLSAYFEWDETGNSGDWTSGNCVLYAYDTQPSTLTTAQKWDQGWTGTKVNSTGTALCLTDGTDKQLQFDSTGLANLQDNISGGEGWFGGMFQGVTGAANGGDFAMTVGETRLSITYIGTPPEPPTGLSCDGIPFGGQCTWTASVNASGVTTYYIQTSTNNSTFANTTSTGNVTSYIITGLTSGQTYFARVNATINNIYNTTSSNHAQFTVPTVPDAPSFSLVAGTGENVIATSTAGASDGGDTVDSFSLRCQTNNTGVWYIVVSNSTLPGDRSYETAVPSYGPLSTVTCQWRDGNSVGWSDWSFGATVDFAVSSTLVAPSSYSTSTINWDLNTVTNPIVFDLDSDGIAETVYSASSYTGPSITLTKVFGTGDTPISFTLPHAASGIYISGNILWFGSGDTDYGGPGGTMRCFFRGHAINIETGDVELNALSFSFQADGTTNRAIGLVGAFNITGSEEIVFGSCTGAAGSRFGAIANQTTSKAVFGGGTTYNVSTLFAEFQHSNGTRRTVLNNGTFTGADIIFGGTNLNFTTGHCRFSNVTTCITTASGYNTSYPKIESSTIVVAPTVRLWNDGFELPSGITASHIPPQYWHDYFETLPDMPYLIDTLLAHYTQFGFDNSPHRFIIYDGSDVGVAFASGNTIQYTTEYPSNRGVQAYIPDTYTRDLLTLETSSQLPTHYYSVDRPTDTVIGDSGGAFTLFSGYIVTEQTVVRSFNPSWTDDSTIKPIIMTPDTGLTQLTILVRNVPSDAFALDIRSLFQYSNDEYYSWTVKEVTADRQLVVDLPTNLCVTIWGKDLSVAGQPFSNMGQLCASGTMPKTVTFLSDLSFTFWTLEWGASSRWDQETSTAQTMVRNNDDGYSYNIRIYDRNGTLQVQQQYTNQTGLDINSFNLTSLQQPLRLEILDQDNSTIYHTILGYGNWLDDIQSFSNQHLTIDGFNLLFMLPLIFAAIWTRNTVSMGTMMTVIFIMVLVFMGVFVVEEFILYMMLFIAAVGMVAYRLLY